MDTSASPMSPEGLVVGPDGRLWICDPNQTNSAKANILQLGQDGSNFQGFAFGLQFSPAVVPEGPSFDGNGDLFFNTTGAAPPGGLGESFGHCV